MKSLVKNVWTGIVNVGWLAVLVLAVTKGQPQAPATPAQAAEMPPTQTQVPSKEAAKVETVPKIDKPTWKRSLPDIMADIQAEADRKKAELEEMQRLMDQVSKDAIHESTPEWTPRIVPHATPNLHETHEAGEPYPYSLARYQNNELRWTINEFRWRLNTRMESGKKFWDLSDLDGPNLDAPLPRRLEDLRKQNWELAWRASRLADMMNGALPQKSWKTPPMPKGITKVPIPSPSCNSDFCRVPVH